MTDKITIARPYATAIFEVAKNAGELESWDKFLVGLESIILNAEFSRVIGNPAFSVEIVNDLILESFLLEPQGEQKQFLKLLLINRRIEIFPEIKTMFGIFCKEDGGTLTVKVLSPYVLTESEKELLQLEVRNRFSRNCDLEVSISPDLIGGVLIKVGDAVVDFSIKGRLQAFERHVL